MDIRDIQDHEASPIEIWLTRKNMTVECRVSFEDESTDEIDVDSLSMRGAQRELTGWLIGLGYQPVGRWTSELEDRDGNDLECSRQFKYPKGRADGTP